MAIRCSPPPPLTLQHTVRIRKPVKVLTNSQIPVKTTTTAAAAAAAATVQIRSFSRNKVFEDQSEGIVCYRDENGEITCEGYDEGPRFQHRLPTLSYHSRDAKIIDLLQKNWLQIHGGGDLNHANKGDAGQKGFNWNEFNTICL